MLATAMAYLDLPPHSRYMSFKVDANWFEAATWMVNHTLVRQVVNEKLDILGTDELMNVCKIVNYALNSLWARKRRRSWKRHAGLRRLYVFLLHMKHFLSFRFKDPSLYEKNVKFRCFSGHICGGRVFMSWRRRYGLLYSATPSSLTERTRNFLSRCSKIAVRSTASGPEKHHMILLRLPRIWRVTFCWI